RSALPVGRELDPGRRVGDAELFRKHVALEKAALAAAIFLRPRHADPAPGRDPLGEFLRIRALLAAARIGGIERPLVDLVGEEGTRFATQDLAGLRQADRIESQV